MSNFRDPYFSTSEHALTDFIAKAVKETVITELAKQKIIDTDKVQLRMQCLQLAVNSDPHGSNDAIKIATAYENFVLGNTTEKAK